MPDLAAFCEEFLTVLDLERNYSTHTLRAYRRNLRQFLSWVTTSGQKGILADLTGATIRNFLAYLREDGRNDARTIAHKLATLKSFLRYLRETLPGSESAGLPKVTWQYKYDRKLQKALSDDELESLLAAVRQRCAQVEARLWAATGRTGRLRKQVAACRRDLLLLLLMAGAGLRVGELCGLNLTDIDLTDRSLRIRGKGRKLRTVYFDIPEMVAAMAEYLSDRCVLGSHPQAVFLNGRDGGRMTARAVQLLLKSYLADAGLERATTAHSLRHTFATLSIERGANVKAVSQLLGHAQVATTLGMYTHLSAEHVRKVFRLCHPRNPQRLPLEEVVALRRRSLLFVKDVTNHGQRQAIAATGG